MTLPKIVPDTCKHSGVLFFFLHEHVMLRYNREENVCHTHGRFTFFCCIYFHLEMSNVCLFVCDCSKCCMTIIFDMFVGIVEEVKSTKKKKKKDYIYFMNDIVDTHPGKWKGKMFVLSCF